MIRFDDVVLVLVPIDSPRPCKGRAGTLRQDTGIDEAPVDEEHHCRTSPGAALTNGDKINRGAKSLANETM